MESANTTIRSQEKEQKPTIQSQENDDTEPANATIWSQEMQRYRAGKCNDIKPANATIQSPKKAMWNQQM